MTRRVVLQPAALADVDAAAVWYEQEHAGLGGRFLDELSDLLERIAENPLQFPALEQVVRRGLLRRFPFGVYFRVEARRVVVIAVLHLHRHPDTWRRRR
ncbi:MAG: type II toxin-antitoxin system RelE/ParE family toxin [Dehalococcoidia bacterium]